MLESILWDMGYRFGSRVADNITAYNMIKKKGPASEANVGTRKAAEKDELGEHLIKETLKKAASTVVVGGALFGLDYLLGIEKNVINMHHIVLYAEGTIGYMAATANVIMTKNTARRAPDVVYLLCILPALHDVYVYKPISNFGKSLRKRITNSSTSAS